MSVELEQNVVNAVFALIWLMGEPSIGTRLANGVK
jgi:hypothetical protein